MKLFLKRLLNKLKNNNIASQVNSIEAPKKVDEEPFNKNTYWTTKSAAETYSNSVHNKKTYDAFLIDRYCEIVRRYTESNKSVMDIGSGTGALTKELSKRGYNVTAVDISNEMLAYSVEQTTKAKYINASVFDLPSDLPSFDVIVSRWFIPHFHNWADIVVLLRKHLKPNGYLFFDMPNQEHIDLFPSFYDVVSKESYGYDFTSKTDSDPYYYSSASINQLDTLAQNSGYKLINCINHGFLKANMAIAFAIGGDSHRNFRSHLSRFTERIYSDNQYKESIANYENAFETASRSCAHQSIVVMQRIDE